MSNLLNDLGAFKKFIYIIYIYTNSNTYYTFEREYSNRQVNEFKIQKTTSYYFNTCILLWNTNTFENYSQKYSRVQMINYYYTMALRINSWKHVVGRLTKFPHAQKRVYRRLLISRYSLHNITIIIIIIAYIKPTFTVLHLQRCCSWNALCYPCTPPRRPRSSCTLCFALIARRRRILSNIGFAEVLEKISCNWTYFT